MSKNLAVAYGIKRKSKKKMANGGVASPTDTKTKTGGSNPGGASTGGVGSGLGGAGTGGAATGGASTGGAGTVNVTLSGNSGTGSNSGGGSAKGKKGKGKESPITINVSHVGGKTGAGKVASGDGPGSSGTGGSGKDSGGHGSGGGDPGDSLEDDKDMKKYARGGSVKNESAKYEARPMPEERDKDSKMVGKNSGNKPPKDDSWTSNVTIKQAQKPSITKLSQPKMVGSDVFSVRNRDMHEDEAHMMDRMPPETDRAQPPRRDDEIDAKKQGQGPHDMERQHSNGRAPYIKEIEDQYAQDMAAAEMKKVQSYARGGPVMEPEDHGDELMERNDEAHMQDSLAGDAHGEQPKSAYDEEDADGSNPNALDMEREHSNGRRPYASGGSVRSGSSTMDYNEGGSIDDSLSHEEDMEHEDSIAAAIMAKKERKKAMMSDSDIDEMERLYRGGMYAEGGEIHSHDSIYSDRSDQADLSRNADEDANEEDQLSFNALRKENYSESEGLDELDSPMDSGQRGDSRERASEDPHDMVDSIRKKMMARRQFKQR